MSFQFSLSGTCMIVFLALCEEFFVPPSVLLETHSITLQSQHLVDPWTHLNPVPRHLVHQAWWWESGRRVGRGALQVAGGRSYNNICRKPTDGTSQRRLKAKLFLLWICWRCSHPMRGNGYERNYLIFQVWRWRGEQKWKDIKLVNEVWI